MLSLLTEGSRCHREIRRYIKAQVGGRHHPGSLSSLKWIGLDQAAVELSHTPANSLRLQVLPPLKDVKIRPEVGSMLRNKLVRLMTHVDMGVKQTAAEFLFVLCKESGERDDGSPLAGSSAPFKRYLSMMSSRSGQPVEVHRLRKRSGAPVGPRAPGRRERRDAILRRRGLGHGGIQICQTLVCPPPPSRRVHYIHALELSAAA